MQDEMQNDPKYSMVLSYSEWLRHLADAVEEINGPCRDSGLSCYLCIVLNGPRAEPGRSADRAFTRRIGHIDEGGMVGTALDAQHRNRLHEFIGDMEDLHCTFGNFLRERYQRWGLQAYQMNELRVKWLREYAAEEEAFELYDPFKGE